MLVGSLAFVTYQPILHFSGYLARRLGLLELLCWNLQRLEGGLEAEGDGGRGHGDIEGSLDRVEPRPAVLLPPLSVLLVLHGDVLASQLLEAAANAVRDLLDRGGLLRVAALAEESVDALVEAASGRARFAGVEEGCGERRIVSPCCFVQPLSRSVMLPRRAIPPSCSFSSECVLPLLPIRRTLHRLIALSSPQSSNPTTQNKRETHASPP